MSGISIECEESLMNFSQRNLYKRAIFFYYVIFPKSYLYKAEFKAEFPYYIYTRKLPPSAGFPSPPGGVAPSVPTLETTADGGGNSRCIKIICAEKKNWGACGAPWF